MQRRVHILRRLRDDVRQRRPRDGDGKRLVEPDALGVEVVQAEGGAGDQHHRQGGQRRKVRWRLRAGRGQRVDLDRWRLRRWQGRGPAGAAGRCSGAAQSSVRARSWRPVGNRLDERDVRKPARRQSRAVLRRRVALALRGVHEDGRILGHRQRAGLVLVDEGVVDDQQAAGGSAVNDRRRRCSTSASSQSWSTLENRCTSWPPATIGEEVCRQIRAIRLRIPVRRRASRQCDRPAPGRRPWP